MRVWTTGGGPGRYCTSIRCLSQSEVPLLIDPQVNVKDAFVLAQAFLPSRNTNAVVIGTSTASVSLDLSLQAGFSSYVTSMLAIVRLFEIMGVEYPDVRFATFHLGIGQWHVYL